MTMLENNESSRVESACVLQIFLPPISSGPSKPSRVHIRNSLELARHGYTPGCTVYEAAMPARNSAERELSKPCLHKLLSAQKNLTPRHSSRHSSDAEHVTKKETFDEHTNRRARSVSAMFIFAWQNQERTSAYSSDHFVWFCVCDPMIVTNPASPKLILSETSDAPMMSADVSVECVREPFWTGTCCKEVERPSATHQAGSSRKGA